MKKTRVDCRSGMVTIVSLTPDEEAAHADRVVAAAQAQQERAGQESQRQADIATLRAAREDVTLGPVVSALYRQLGYERETLHARP